MLAALLYGITFPLVHDALEDITPFAYLVGRFGIALLFVAPAAWIAARGMADRALLWRAGVIAGLLLFGGYATQTVGLQYTSPSTSAFITGLYVVLTPVVEAVVYRRVPGRAVWAGIVLATIGLYLLTGADVHLGRGELLTLACAVLFAGHIVYLGAYARRVPPAAFTGVQLGMVAVLSVPAAGASGHRHHHRARGVRGGVHGHRVLGDRAAAPAVGAASHPAGACGADPAGRAGVRGHRRVHHRRAARRAAGRGCRDHPGGDRGVGARLRVGARHVESRAWTDPRREPWTRRWRDRSDAGRDRGVGAAHRVGRGRTEMWLAETLAARVAEAPDAAAKIDLVRRARLHAWHADLWKSVAPVLHDLSVDAAADLGGPDRRGSRSRCSSSSTRTTEHGKPRRALSPRRRSSGCSGSSAVTTRTERRG